MKSSLSYAVAFLLVSGIGTMVRLFSTFHKELFPSDMGACKLKQFHLGGGVQEEQPPIVETALQKFWEHPTFSGECRYYRYIPECLLPMFDYPLEVSFGQFCYHAIWSLFHVAGDALKDPRMVVCIIFLSGLALTVIWMCYEILQQEKEWAEYKSKQENARLMRDVRYLFFIGNELFNGNLSLWEGVMSYITTEEELESAIPVLEEKFVVQSMKDAYYLELVLEFFEKKESDWSFKVLMGVFDMWRKMD